VQRFEVLPNEDAARWRAAGAGAADFQPALFSAYRRVLHSSLELVPGRTSCAVIYPRASCCVGLARAPGRGTAHVIVPEGFNHVQLAERLEQLGVCDAEDFRRAVRDGSMRASLADGAQRRGLPVSAHLRALADSTPSAVVAVLVAEAQKHLARLQSELGPQLRRGKRSTACRRPTSWCWLRSSRRKRRGAMKAADRQRLSQPPARSDVSSAAHAAVRSDRGLRLPRPRTGAPRLAAPAARRRPCCATRRTSTTRTVTLDYRQARSPAPVKRRSAPVLTPAKTDYLYFVAQGGGRHRFSRTFSEHRGAIEKSP
jgi:UPF0755 protein